ncbi:MAG: YCF48-related protein, partial [Bacteroidota bacterium]
MKTKLTLFLLLLASSLQLMFSQTWEYSNALENEWMRKICTQGLDTVYIVGRNGLIARSTDRSETWTKQYPVTDQLNDIIFCNNTTGFAVGNNGTILKTVDGGDTWIQVTSGTSENLNAIAAASIGNIWTVGDNGMVLYSHDCGSVWQVKDLSLTAQLNDISFRNSTGYIIGSNSVCYKTTDTGDSWNNLDLISGDNLIVQQTENGHLYILYNYDFETTNIYSDGNISSTEYVLTSFYMVNDSIGYGGLLPRIPTGVGGGHVLMTLYKFGKYIGDIYLPINSLFFDQYSSDILIINDSIGYAVTGGYLYRINNNLTGLNEQQINADLLIKQERDCLKIMTRSLKKDLEVEIISLYGFIIYKQKGDE